MLLHMDIPDDNCWVKHTHTRTLTCTYAFTIYIWPFI